MGSVYGIEEGGVANPCRHSAQEDMVLLKMRVNEYFKEDGMEISVNPDPKKVLDDEDGSIRIRLECCIRRILIKYQKELYKSGSSDPFIPHIVLIGEHSPQGKFHFHGIYRGISNDLLSKIKRSIVRCLGRTEVKMIKYQQSYIDYMFKSYIDCQHHNIQKEIPRRDYCVIIGKYFLSV